MEQITAANHWTINRESSERGKSAIFTWTKWAHGNGDSASYCLQVLETNITRTCDPSRSFLYTYFWKKLLKLGSEQVGPSSWCHLLMDARCASICDRDE